MGVGLCRGGSASGQVPERRGRTCDEQYCSEQCREAEEGEESGRGERTQSGERAGGEQGGEGRRCAAGPEMEPGGDCGSHDRGAPEDSEQNPGGQDQDGVGGAEQGERAHHAAPQDAVNTHLRRIFLRGLPLRGWVVARR